MHGPIPSMPTPNGSMRLAPAARGGRPQKRAILVHAHAAAVPATPVPLPLLSLRSADITCLRQH